MSRHPNANQTLYKVGEEVEVRDPASGKWRRARITSLASYGGGYYADWLDLPYSHEERRAKDLPMPSSGGWAYNAVIRRPG